MDVVKSWSLSVCISLVVVSILTIVSPSLSRNKVLHLVFSIFVLGSLINPLVNLKEIKFDFKSIESDIKKQEYISHYNEVSKKIVEESAAKALFPLIQKEIAENGIDEFGMDINLSDNQNGYVLEEIIISIYSNNEIDKNILKNILSKKTGLNIVIK